MEENLKMSNRDTSHTCISHSVFPSNILQTVFIYPFPWYPEFGIFTLFLETQDLAFQADTQVNFQVLHSPLPHLWLCSPISHSPKETQAFLSLVPRRLLRSQISLCPREPGKFNIFSVSLNLGFCPTLQLLLNFQTLKWLSSPTARDLRVYPPPCHLPDNARC